MDYAFYFLRYTDGADYAHQDCYKLFHHYFPILQQPSGSVMPGFHVCDGMDELVREYNPVKSHNNLKNNMGLMQHLHDAHTKTLLAVERCWLISLMMK